jgi:hypothetical protein
MNSNDLDWIQNRENNYRTYVSTVQHTSSTPGMNVICLTEAMLVIKYVKIIKIHLPYHMQSISNTVKCQWNTLPLPWQHYLTSTLIHTWLKHITYHHPSPRDHTLCISPIGWNNKNGSSGPLPTNSHQLRTSPLPLPSYITHSLLRHVQKIVRKQLLALSRLSVCLFVHLSAWKNSAPTGWIFTESDIWVFLKKSVRWNSRFIYMWQE